MSFETELSDRLHTEADDTQVDLDLLLTGSVAYGNKLVRRRRLTRIIGGAATIAVLGGAVAYAGSLNAPPGSTPAPAASVATTQPQKAKADITPQAALGVLLELLPDASQATNHRGGFDGTGKVLGVYTTVSYGNASLRLEVLKEQQVAFPCDAYYTGCNVVKLPDGSKLRLLDTSVPGPGGKDDYQQLQANLTRKDGLSLNLIAVNQTPAQPAITLAQLKTIAVSPRWQLKLDQAFIDRSEKLFIPRLVTQPSVPG
ncbi:hypothetical protein [Streptomyces sp. SID13031]|uniref:hypothetical protein n=1 Tax=Streptomyces sp. SID13031 TaxID=2706046 RepID=UPI0013CAB59D|nr:hypothetical protein [Streptomyces sp. SID13031]NEA35983.1 hypothetical protein [Streptomyces sp. SID13031]